VWLDRDPAASALSHVTFTDPDHGAPASPGR
jgi:hypothetical protein